MLFSRNYQPIIRYTVRMPNKRFTKIIVMRIMCGRALFEFYADLPELFSMRLLIRIRVDKPFHSYQVAVS